LFLTTAGVHGVYNGTYTTSTPSAQVSGGYPAGSFIPGSTIGVESRVYASTLNPTNTNNDSLSFASTAETIYQHDDLHLNTGLTPTPLESGALRSNLFPISTAAQTGTVGSVTAARPPNRRQIQWYADHAVICRPAPLLIKAAAAKSYGAFSPTYYQQQHGRAGHDCSPYLRRWHLLASLNNTDHRLNRHLRRRW
jgi:hypothetical protein